MIGRTYLERGQPVLVLKRWGRNNAGFCEPIGPLNDCSWSARGGPRNVLIQRPDGERVVRPFRGLRKLPEAAKAAPLPDSDTGGKGA